MYTSAKGGIVLKYILSKRSFRSIYHEKIQQLAPDYQLVSINELPDSFRWEQVVITIGWDKKWADKLLHSATNLKWVQSISAGVDYLPLESFAKYGILLSNGSGIHAQSISDHLLGLLLMKTRGLFPAMQQQMTHTWESETIPYDNLSEQVITIVGTGQIGQELARKLSLLGCSVQGINTTGRKTPYFSQTYPLTNLHACAQESDIVINILPLTEDTRHLYDQPFFQAMKKTGSFINVGRGPSVDSHALLAALQANDLAFASIDVTDPEPLPKDDPLWDAPNLLITPHISGQTAHFQSLFMEIFLKNFSSFTQNHSLTKNEVSLENGY